MPKVVFCLTWGLLNFFWLAVLRRPAVSAALSLAMIVVLILLSRLKYEIIWMTANFLDVMIINADTVGFLLAVKPDLYGNVLLALALVLPALTLLWWIDAFRVRLRTAVTGFAACAAALARHLARVPAGGMGYVRRRRLRVQIRHARASPRCPSWRRTAIWNPTPPSPIA